MKKLLGIFLAVMILATSFAAVPIVGLADETPELVVEINGETVNLDPAPVVRDDVLYMPLRAVCGAFGYDIGWDSEANAAVVNGGGVSAQFVFGASEVKVSGKPASVSAPVFAENGVTYVPIDALNTVGASAVWHRSANVVEITVDKMNGRYYRIVQKSSGKAFSLENNALWDGVRIVLADVDGSDTQVWRFTSRGDGRYAVVNKKSRRSFDIPNGRSDIELNLIIYGITDGTNQWIRPIDRGDGTYLLQCAHDENLYMTERADGVIAQNVLVGDDTQIFELQEVEVSASANAGSAAAVITETDEYNGKLVSILFQAGHDSGYGALADKDGEVGLAEAGNLNDFGIDSFAPGDNRIWKVTLRGDNRYQFTNKESGLALTVKDGALTLEKPTLNTNQMFAWVKIPSLEMEGGHALRNVATGQYLIAADGKNPGLSDRLDDTYGWIYLDDETTIDLASEYTPETIGGKFYRVTVASTGKTVTTADESVNNGAAITVADANDSDIQVWNFMTQGGGRYIITNKLSRRSFDIPGGSKEEGASVTQYDTNYGNNQIFELVPAGNGSYYLKNKGSELYITEVDGKFTQELMGRPGHQTFNLTEVGESNEKLIGSAATLFVLKGDDKVSNAKVQWATITNAAKYDVYRSVDGGDYTLMAVMTGTTIDDYDLEIGREYTYFVVAMDDEGNVIDSAYSNTVVPYMLPADLKSSSNLEESGFQRPNSLCVDGVYYRFYEEGGGPGGGFSRIMMRTSTDDITYSDPVEVMNYEDVLSHETCKDFSSARFESQNYVYNPVANKFAFIAHFEADGGYGTARTSIATATPGERFTFHGAIRPEGGDTRDLNVYVDDDNKAYLIAAINVNADLALYELNEDWSGVERMVCIVNRSSWRELPGMMKVDGIYYLFTSGTAGWYPTQGMYNTAASIDGPWSPLRAVGNTTTFSSQSGSVSRLKPGSENYMMSTYRWMYFWQDAVVKRTTNRRYPISVHDGFAFYDFYDELLYSWDNDYLIPVQNGRILSQDMPVTSDSLFGDSGLANDGNYRTIWTAGSLDGVDSKWPYVWEVDLGETRTLTELQISWLIWNGSEPYYQYKVEGSNDGRNFTTILDNTEGFTDYGFTIDQLSANARFVRVTVYNARPRSHPDDNNYPPQIYEVKVLGK